VGFKCFRGPGAGRDGDGAGWLELAGDGDASRAGAVEGEEGGLADAELGAGLAGAGGEGVRGGCGRDRATGLQAPGDEALGKRRLRGAQVGALEQGRAQLRELGRLGLEVVGVVGDEQHPDRVGGQLEPATERRVMLDGLLVEPNERGVERMLDDAGVAP
jgi:hypothetical protein